MAEMAMTRNFFLTQPTPLPLGTIAPNGDSMSSCAGNADEVIAQSPLQIPGSRPNFAFRRKRPLSRASGPSMALCAMSASSLTPAASRLPARPVQLGIDLFLHQQDLNTTTPAGRRCFR